MSPPERRVWNTERSGYDVEGPCWACQQPIRYFVDEDGTPRDIVPAAPQPLDVERLARAVHHENWGDDVDRADLVLISRRQAERLAEAYARLGSQEGSATDE